ncbi:MULTISPECIES: P-loop NTPase fold protein [unclassified Bradyrhizobium]
MEKFVQVPFRIPSPGQREIARWVTGMASGAINQTPESPNDTGLEEIREGSDPAGFEQVVERIARLFDFNPRRIKQFINIFRLRVMVALSTGVLTVRVQTTTGGLAAGGITMEQLGMLTAILMRWPQIITDLLDDPKLLQKIASSSSNSSNLDAVAKWSADRELKEAINLDLTYSLSNVDLTPVLMIMPNIYVGNLSARANKNRTQLVSGRAGQIAVPKGPDDAPEAANNAPTGPTGSGPQFESPSTGGSSSARRVS